MNVTDLPWVVLVAAIAALGLLLSNYYFDRHLPHYLSRKIGHGAGGVAYLLLYLIFDQGWWALILSIIFAVGLAWANKCRPSTFRGVGGSGRATPGFSEAAFPLAAVPVIVGGWIVLDQPDTVLACLLFMAWGDMVTGIVRARVYGGPVKGAAGSWAMLVVCVLISFVLVRPIWVAGIGAGVAVEAERNCGDVSRISWLRSVDDNFAIPVATAMVMIPLVEIFGNS